MKKDYQTKTAAAATAVEAVMPDAVSVTLAELAGSLREGLLALAVGAGFQVMARHHRRERVLRWPDRRAATTRTAPRCVTAPRTARWSWAGGGCRSAGPGSAPPTAPPRWRCRPMSCSRRPRCSTTMALERMMAKLSTRRYPAGLEPVGAAVEATGRSTSKSAISRRFVAATESALADMLAADLSGLDLVALMIDGVHFAEHLCVVALGIGIDGTKHPLGLVEGDTENTTVVRDLLADLRDRGLDTTRPILCVLDGAKALVAGGQGRVRPPGHPTLPAPQDPKRRVEAARRAGLDRGQEDARRLPQPRCTRRRGDARGPRPASSPPTTPAPPGACARDWPRPSPSPAWAYLPPWPARCARRTRSSR